MDHLRSCSYFMMQGGLFEQLTQLLALALEQEGKQRAATIRCKQCCHPRECFEVL